MPESDPAHEALTWSTRQLEDDPAAIADPMFHRRAHVALLQSIRPPRTSARGPLSRRLASAGDAAHEDHGQDVSAAAQENHGVDVSTVARDTPEDDASHGEQVSEAAHDNHGAEVSDAAAGGYSVDAAGPPTPETETESDHGNAGGNGEAGEHRPGAGENQQHGR